MGISARVSQEGMQPNKWTSRCRKDVQIRMPRTLIPLLEVTMALASMISRMSDWRIEQDWVVF